MSYATTPVRPVAGRLALDFLNTANWADDGEVISEKLVSPTDVIRWTNALGITRAVTDGRTHDLDALRHLRSELRAIFLSVLTAQAPDRAAIELVNGLLLSISRRSQLVRITDSPWLVIESPLIDAVLTSAKAILTDPREIGRVSLCSGTECGWLFLDESRLQRRRWCQMQTCGNRAKARRFYAKQTTLSDKGHTGA